VVVYDRLIHPRLLEEVPVEAERIFVGKARGLAVLDQRAIEALLIDRACAGRRVVRLKGGDPFVFGRGGEEVEALAAAGVPYEVIPGLTSATSVPASAGIPVTHRALASTVTIVTGHDSNCGRQEGQTQVDWAWLARGTGTLVILMGLERLETICEQLIAGGRGASTPAAVIAAGTWPHQRSVMAQLADLAEAVAEGALQSPAVIVVGEVARFPEMVADLGLAAMAEAV
jgi:uroporphyrin-III C-methyltransferase